MIKAIAFDWGGVFTVGTFDGRSTARLAETFALELETVRRVYFEFVARLELGEWTLEHFWQVVSRKLGLEHVGYAEFESLYLGSIFENEPMFQMLAELSPDLRLGMLSNNYPVICDHVRTDKRFARIDAMVFSNEIGAKKPDLMAFRTLEEALSVRADQTVFIDDVSENLIAAAEAGFQTMLYDAADHAAFSRALHERFPGVLRQGSRGEDV